MVTGWPIHPDHCNGCRHQPAPQHLTPYHPNPRGTFMTEKQHMDLTTPEAVAIGQGVYDRIVAGEIKAADVEAELDAALGREGRG